jgi:hypothetical protein
MKKCQCCGKEIKFPRPNQKYCSNSCSAQSRVYTPKEYQHDITVWSCGGGVQSTAIAALICIGKLPPPDYSLMVDVGMERRSTWDYVHNHLIPNLRKHGHDLTILHTEDYTDTELFKDGCFVLPAHRLRDGKRLKMKTMCNGNWKVRVQRTYLRNAGITCFENWIGISTDEARRARQSDTKSVAYRYPLIEMGYSRYGCLDLIKSLGWELPPHTACWCCPNATNDEWLDLKLNYPDDWTKAVELEKQVRSKDGEIYFHHSLKPLEQAFS